MKRKEDDIELDFFERLVSKNPNFVDALLPLAEIYTKRGLYTEGLKIDQKLTRLQPKDPIVRYNLACSLALVGETKKALTALKASVRLGYRDFNHISKDADLKTLHQEPEFQVLLNGSSKKKRS